MASRWPGDVVLDNIGIVDDDDAVRDAISILLRLNGFDVTAYNSGPSLLGDDQLDRFRCLILDIHMPMMSGIELFELLRRRNIMTPVILVTGRDEPRELARIKAIGTVKVLQKPVLEQTLMAEVRDALAQHTGAHT